MSKQIKVIAVCISEKKGTQKSPVEEIQVMENWGAIGDAHAGNWHRQISILNNEKVDQFKKNNISVPIGAFGENLLIEGVDVSHLPIGTKFISLRNNTTLELTQIGKECHHGCAIKNTVGDCIMPKSGIFSKVVVPGTIKKDDIFDVILPFTARILTVSDKGYAKKRQDKSGPEIKNILIDNGFNVEPTIDIVPDEINDISSWLISQADSKKYTLLLTTGGTGFSMRDFTPEATMNVIEREVPGIPEAMRYLSLQITPNAMLTRAKAGIRKQTLIINLPGSPKAVRECLEYILPALIHGLGVLTGDIKECANNEQ